jgi:hypothetical protein
LPGSTNTFDNTSEARQEKDFFRGVGQMADAERMLKQGVVCMCVYVCVYAVCVCVWLCVCVVVCVCGWVFKNDSESVANANR